MTLGSGELVETFTSILVSVSGVEHTGTVSPCLCRMALVGSVFLVSVYMTVSKARRTLSILGDG